MSLCRHKQLRMLTEIQLNKLNTRRLLGVLKSARAVEQSEIQRWESQGWCCEVCKEYVGGDWETEVGIRVKPFTDYKNLVKSILSTREHVK